MFKKESNCVPFYRLKDSNGRESEKDIRPGSPGRKGLFPVPGAQSDIRGIIDNGDFLILLE